MSDGQTLFPGAKTDGTERPSFPDAKKNAPKEHSFPGATASVRTEVSKGKPASHLPDGLRTPREAAAKLHCSEKTLAAHVAAGELAYVQIGQGKTRPRKFFTDANLDAFIAARTKKDTPCPLPKSRARRTGTSISKCEVIDFAAPRKPPTGATRKK